MFPPSIRPLILSIDLATVDPSSSSSITINVNHQCTIGANIFSIGFLSLALLLPSPHIHSRPCSLFLCSLFLYMYDYISSSIFRLPVPRYPPRYQRTFSVVVVPFLILLSLSIFHHTTYMGHIHKLSIVNSALFSMFPLASHLASSSVIYPPPPPILLITRHSTIHDPHGFLSSFSLSLFCFCMHNVTSLCSFL